MAGTQLGYRGKGELRGKGGIEGKIIEHQRDQGGIVRRLHPSRERGKDKKKSSLNFF